MKNIYKSLLAIVFVLGATGAGAQMKTAYFMEGSIPRYDLNPALTPQDGYVNFPLLPIGALGINVDNNFAAVDNFIYPDGRGGHVTFMHPSVDAKDFLRKMPNRATLGVDLNYSLLGFGNYSKKHNYFWSFGWNMRVDADVAIPGEIFSVLKDLRNGAFDMSDISVGAMAYSEFALGFAAPIGWQNIVIGGRVKFLVGLADVDARLTNVRLDIGSDKIGVSAGGTVRASVFGVDNTAPLATDENGGINIADMLDFSRFSMNNAFKSYGAAIDLGAEAKLFGQRLKISAAVNDLGFIKWNRVNNIIADMDDITYEFRGINLDTNEAEMVEPDGGIVFRQQEAQGYTRRLNTTLNIGAEYNFFKNLIGIGVLSHTRFSGKNAYSELTLTGTVRPGKWFTAAVSHSLIQNKIGVLGLALNFHPRGINFFLGFDYVPTQMARIDGVPVPQRLKSFNTYLGLAFTPKGRSKPWK
jgi:hypothetical protein